MTDHVCPRCGAGHSSLPDPDYEDAAQEDAMSADAKLVPREPTHEMIVAGSDNYSHTPSVIWRAMYDAAPAPAAEPPCAQDLHTVIHQLRNPWGWPEDVLRTARLAAADELERRIAPAAAPSAEPHSAEAVKADRAELTRKRAAAIMRGEPKAQAPSAGAGDDHARGCEGRTYTCTCGYDGQRDAELARLRTESEQLREELVDKQRGINWNVARAEQAEAERDKLRGELARVKLELGKPYGDLLVQTYDAIFERDAAREEIAQIAAAVSESATAPAAVIIKAIIDATMEAEAERDAANLRDQDTLRTCQYWIGEYNNCVAERDAAAAEVARLTIINDNHSECALIYTRENDELTDQRDAAVARADKLESLLSGAIQSMATHGNELTQHANNLDAIDAGRRARGEREGEG